MNPVKRELVYALESSNFDHVRNMIRDPKCLEMLKGHVGQFFLKRALNTGATSTARFLLNHGLSLDDVSCYNPPLHVAILHGDIELIQCLLSFGADIERADADGTTPLLFAINQNRSDIVKILLESGAKPDNNGGNDSEQPYPLALAIERNLMESVELLLSYYHNMSDAHLKWTYRHSIKYSRDEISTFVYSTFGDHLRKTRKSVIKLFKQAVSGGCFKTVDYILSNDFEGIDDMMDIINEAVYTIICADGIFDALRVETLKVLISYGADVNYKHLDMTPLQAALQIHQHCMVKFLLNNGGSVDFAMPPDEAPLNFVIDMLEQDPWLCDLFLNCDLLECYLRKGGYKLIDMRGRGKKSVLHIAREPRNIITLLRYFPCLELCDATGESGFEKILSSFKDNQKVVRQLGMYVHYCDLAKLYVHSETKAIINKITAPLDIAYSACPSEFEQMKQMAVEKKTSKVNVYEFLTFPIKRLVFSECLEGFNDINFNSKFPFYANLLNRKRHECLREKKRRNYLPGFITCVRNSLDFELPLLVYEKIFNYISDDDLKEMFPSESV